MGHLVEVDPLPLAVTRKWMRPKGNRLNADPPPPHASSPISSKWQPPTRPLRHKGMAKGATPTPLPPPPPPPLLPPPPRSLSSACGPHPSRTSSWGATRHGSCSAWTAAGRCARYVYTPMKAHYTHRARRGLRRARRIVRSRIQLTLTTPPLLPPSPPSVRPSSSSPADLPPA